MNKKLKIGLTVVGSILGVIIIAVISIVIYAFTDKNYGYKDPLTAAPFFSTWQTGIKDEARLNDVVIPGSHDAGSEGMMPIAQTQGHSVADQLKGGARYFDLRVKYKGDDLVLFHDIISGQKFSAVLNDIRDFLALNPDQFLVLDFQHLGDTAHKGTIEAIKNTLDMDKALKKSVYENIETTTFGDVRSHGYNFVVVWTDAAESASEDFLYARNENLKSPYDGDIHKKTSETLIEHFQTYYDGYDDKGFFVLQSQRTAPFILDKPSRLESEFKPLVNNYIDALATSANLKKTNIIMRDFLVSDMTNVKKILALNLSKNLVTEQAKADFLATVS